MTAPRYRRGISLVEVIIGTALFAVVGALTVQGLWLFFTEATRVREETKALLLAIEGQEMVRGIRDADWSDITALTVGNTYSLSVGAGTLALGTTPEVIDGYTRTVVVSAAYRNSNDELVPQGTSGAVSDPGSRLVTVTVAWDGEEVELASLVTNIFDI